MGWRPSSDGECSRPGSSRLNNFDLVRLVAAAGVLVSHSFAVSGHREPSIGRLTLGSMSVAVFFGISGFLITQSWLLEPEPGRFIVKRALRIYPALAAVLLITAVLGVLISTMSPADYFSYGAPSRYVLHNLLMQPLYDLPGVFVSNPLPNWVNGSLWTLEFEVHAYLIVLFAGLVGMLRSKALTPLLWSVVIVAAAMPGGREQVGPPELLLAFGVGSLLYVLRDHVAWTWWLAAGALATWCALSGFGGVGEYAARVALPYVAILAACRAPLAWRRFTSRGDFSYGLYLWAYPVQQTIAWAWHDVPAPAMIALSAAVTAPLAAASWLLVERPALSLKKRLISGRPSNAAPAGASAAAP